MKLLLLFWLLGWSCGSHHYGEKRQHYVVMVRPCVRTSPRYGEWCAWKSSNYCDPSTCVTRISRSCECPAPPSEIRRGCRIDIPQREAEGSDNSADERFSYTMDRLRLPVVRYGKVIRDCLSAYSPEVCNATNVMMEDNWANCPHWIIKDNRTMKSSEANLALQTFTSKSTLGVQCSNPMLLKTNQVFLPPCKYQRFFSKYDESVFTHFTNLAFDVEECKFACAINPLCVAVVFRQNYICVLLSGLPERPTQKPGRTIHIKPALCTEIQKNIDPEMGNIFYEAVRHARSNQDNFAKHTRLL